VALASLVFRLDQFVDTIDDFRDWLDICEQYGRPNLLDTDPVWSVSAAEPSSRISRIHRSPIDSLGRLGHKSDGRCLRKMSEARLVSSQRATRRSAFRPTA